MIRIDLLHYELEQAELPVVGVSSDGRIDYSRELTEVEQQTAAAIIAAHDPTGLLPEEQAERDSISGYQKLPDWARTANAQDAGSYINAQIWNGQTVEQVNAWIDANITDITTANVSQINARLANIRLALRLTASAVIAMRELFILTAKLLIYVRDLVIRFRA
jgi:hypothetical protein